MWALIDLSALAHRALHTTKDLSFDDTKTGIIFGVFDQIRTLSQDPHIATNQIAIFADSFQSFRKRQFPAYKERRHKYDDLTDEERQELSDMKIQRELLIKEIFPSIGIPVYRQNGCESDDLMAMASKTFIGNTLQAVMVTADGDLWQCITHAVHWYDPQRKHYYDRDSFFTKKTVYPEYWADVKAMMGCSTDEVPGIPGVGETSAIDFSNAMLPSKNKRYQKIKSPEGQAIIKRNLDLVKLPHKRTLPIELKPPEFNESEFRKWMERFGIESFFKDGKSEQWQNFFTGKGMDKQRQATRSRKATLL